VPSHQRGRVCNLVLLLVLASAVKLGLPSLTRGRCPHFIDRQQLYNHVPAATIPRKNRRIVARVSVGLSLHRPFVAKLNSVKTFPWHRIIFGGVLFYAVSIVKKENRRLVLATIFCVFKT
jgi:hypothetical protein